MYCSFCGKEIEDGARFCNHCGAQLETGMQAGASGDTTSVSSDATQVMPGAEFNSGATQIMPEAEHQSNSTQQIPQTPPAPDPSQLVTPSPFGSASNSSGNNPAGGTSSAPGMPGALAQKQPLSRNAKIGIAVGAGVVAVAVIVVIVLAVSGFFNPSPSEPTANSDPARTTIIDKTDPQDSQSDEDATIDSDRDSQSHESDHSSSSSDSYTSSSIDGYSTYTNGRFGYSVAYPSDYVLSQEYEDGSGVIFDSDSRGDMSIAVWGKNNTYGESAKSTLSDLEEYIGIEGYTASGDNWFVYSYEMDGQVIYLKGYVGDGSMVGMSITYPESMSTEGDAMVETMEPTLEPGDISVSH